MTTAELIAQAKAHNQKLDDYHANLVATYGEKVPALTMLRIMGEFCRQGFYEQALPIVEALQAQGIKATINCQSYEIFLPYQYR